MAKRYRRKLESLTEEEWNNIVTDYRVNNVSLRGIQEKYDVNRSKVAKKLEKEKVKTTYGNHYRTYFHNFDYFEIIDTHEKAYWLGFIMADGYIQRYKGKFYGEDNLGITLHEKDCDMLYKFKKAICATNPIKFYEEKVQEDWIKRGYSRTGKTCRILLKSQKTCDDLMKKEVVYNKSTVKKFPTNEQVPKEFIYSYIRGYMDGNGCVHVNYNKTIPNYCSLSFCTSELFAKGLFEILGGKLYKDKRENVNSWSLKLNKEESKYALHNIYKDSTEETRMERKYIKYIDNL